MKLNQKATSMTKIVSNPEGQETFVDRLDRALLMQGLDLKLRHTFYKSPDEKLNSFSKVVRDNKDRLYVKAVVNHLKDMGMRLSPAVILGELEMKGEVIPELAKHVYTRPDIIANTLAYLQMNGVKSISNVSQELRTAIKESIEGMKDITLKKRRMARHNIKLADLIKVFRPRPDSADRSALYKGIIENTVRLTTDESVATLLSDNKLSKEQKVDKLKKNVKKVAVNELVRNISQVGGENLDEETADKLKERFADIDISKTQQVNPFDLIVTQKNFDYELSLTMDKAVQKYVDGLDTPSLGRVGYLVDVSGSMMPGWGGNDDTCGLSQAFKFLSIMRNVYKPSMVKFFHNHIVTDSQAKKCEKDIMSKVKPTQVYNIYHDAKNIPSGGTDVIGSVKYMLAQDVDTVVVFTDEVQNYGYTDYLKEYNKLLASSGKHLIVVNTDYSGNTNQTPYSHSGNVLMIAGLSGKVFEYIASSFDFGATKKKIIAAYVARFGKYDKDCA